MKLHLPLSLRSALVLSVAAFAAAPSHAAVTQLTIPDYDEAVGYAAAGTTSDGTTNSLYVALPTAQTWNTSWSVVFSANGPSLTGTLTLLGLYMQNTKAGHANEKGVSEGVKMEGNNLTLTTWSQAAITKNGVDFTGYDNITFSLSRNNADKSLTLTAYDSSNFAAGPLLTLTRADQTFGDHNLEGFVLGALGTHTKYNNSNNKVAFTADASVGDYELTKAGFSSGSVASVSDLANYYYSDAKTLTWSGGLSGSWDAAVWNDGDDNSQTFSSYDSVVFNTEGAEVTLGSATSANSITIEANTGIVLTGKSLKAASLTVADGQTFTLTGEGSAVIGDLAGGAVKVNNSTLSVTELISNTTLTVENGGAVTANSITGTTAAVAEDATLTLAGTTLSNSTITGTLTLTTSGHVNLAGNVTLDSVVNHMTGSSAYVFLGGDNTVNLTFKGTTDLTINGNGTAASNAKIGLNSSSKIVVDENASLKAQALYNTGNNSASIYVKEGGSVDLIGFNNNGTNMCSYAKTLTNEGTFKATSLVQVNESLTNTGTLTAATLKIINGNGAASTLGGIVDVTSLQLHGGAATVSGAVTATQIAGGSAKEVGVFNVVNDGTLKLTGTALGNTTVNGTLTLEGKERVTVTGNVTLDAVANNLTASNGGYAFVGNSGVTLTFTGTTDLTKKSDGVTDTTHSKIGLAGGKLIVAEGASLTTSTILNSTGSLASNAHVEVAVGGALVMSGKSQNYLLSLVNNGAVTAGSGDSRADVYVHNQVANTGTLSANTLRIANTGGVESTLGGTVNLDRMLQLDSGTVVISGNVTAGSVGNVGGVNVTGVYKGTDTGSGTMTIRGNIGDSTSSSTLSGNFAIVKQGASTQTFNGKGTTGANAKDGNERFAGSLKVEGGTLNVTNIDLSRIAEEVSAMNLQEVCITHGATLGLYTTATANNASAATISASKLKTVAGEGTQNATLNANVVMGAGSALELNSTLTLKAGGALTLDGTLLSGALLDSLNRGAVDSITLFTGVSSLTIGSEAATLAAEGETFSAVTFGGNRDFTAAELSAAFGNAFDPNVYTASYTADNGGSIIMTANVPEPATATLSLLALAGLCARRRRK